MGQRLPGTCGAKPFGHHAGGKREHDRTGGNRAGGSDVCVSSPHLGRGDLMASLTERSGGFAPIESYGVIGDGRSAALVARDGAIDWWAAPAMDSTPLFAAVLDPGEGGCFTLAPTVPYTADQRYLPGTNVLETTFRTEDGTVRV